MCFLLSSFASNPALPRSDQPYLFGFSFEIRPWSAAICLLRLGKLS
jgi:hypothetical protein